MRFVLFIHLPNGQLTSGSKIKSLNSPVFLSTLSEYHMGHAMLSQHPHRLTRPRLYLVTPQKSSGHPEPTGARH